MHVYSRSKERLCVALCDHCVRCFITPIRYGVELENDSCPEISEQLTGTGHGSVMVHIFVPRTLYRPCKLCPYFCTADSVLCTARTNFVHIFVPRPLYWWTDG